MKYLIPFLLVLLAQYLPAQSCSCTDELDFVVRYYEQNLPGFKDNVTKETRKSYETLKAELRLLAQNAVETTDCFKLLTYYVEFFKDNHSHISMESEAVNDKDPAAVQAFKQTTVFAKRERIELNSRQYQNRPLNDIEGIYQTKDSVYTILIVANKKGLRDYVGVILESKTPLWEPGQVKLELRHKAGMPGVFEAFMYMRNHSLQYYHSMVLQDGRLGDNWFKTSLKERHDYNLNPSNNVEFRALDAETNYMRIPTFSGHSTAMLDTFYAHHDAQVRAKPYLIIDVRNNGGGNDGNARQLLEYIYTGPFKSDVVDVYVTKDNIKVFEEWYSFMSKDTLNFDQASLDGMRQEINRMKKQPEQSYMRRSDGGMVKLDSVLKWPSKVAIIVNNKCASSCESLLFWAKESKKTILVGENSGGYVGYGEIGGVETPCFAFNLGCTMTRYRHQRKYEVVGIAPDYRLDNHSDWLEQTMRLLKQ
ncbi:MAG TPA: S41 family peptidase [Saprospiraceae bacterium]|nr:S41 family peptidase [Saprospiraceae bacterium]